jgi:ribosomal protein S21
VIFLIEVKRKNDERLEVLVRRFNREVQQSGVMSVAKKKRYFEKEQNRNLRRVSAIRKAKINTFKRGY